MYKCLIFAFLLLFSCNAQAEESILNLLEAKTNTIEKELRALKKEMHDIEKKQLTKKPSSLSNSNPFPENPTILAGMPVITQPFVGRRPGFDADGELIYRANTNQDILYMIQRDNLEKTFAAHGDTITSPIITLNGIFEPLFTYGNSFSETGSGNLNMASVVLNTGVVMNPWISGVTSLIASSEPVINDAVANEDANVQMSQAYINIGNLSETPFYMTAGQVYVPFGQQFTNMVSFPLPTVINSTKVMATVLGKAPQESNDFFSAVYAFNSKTSIDNTGAGGFNMGYNFNYSKFDGDIGAGIISSLGDANGFQSTIETEGEFSGFNSSTSSETFNQVPGADLYGLLRAGPYSFVGEYTAALCPFDAYALSYNGGGAQPSALNAEIAREFSFLHKSASFALGYGYSSQAIALQLPQQTLRAILNVSWWPRTLQALEFEHNIDYGSNDYGSGVGSTVNTNGTGKSSDVVEFLFTASF
jgi:hypothetical protein